MSAPWRPRLLKSGSGPEILEEIDRLRKKHPNLGKEKLYPFVRVFLCRKPKGYKARVLENAA
jgi:hypothetical protein